MLRKVGVVLFLILTLPRLHAQEPSGGVITDLVFFDDAINPRARFATFSTTFFGVDIQTRHNGLASFRLDVTQYGGFQAYWNGLIEGGGTPGPDSAVFWVQPNSRLQLWARSSATDANNVYILFRDNSNCAFQGVYQTPITVANTWFFIDVPLPSFLRNSPLKQIEIGTGAGPKSFWIDDFKLTNVRLYAGKGVAGPADFPMIAASQLGYAPFTMKQFSSPVPFTSFEIKRTSDNATVFTGGGVVRVDSDAVIGGKTVWIGDFTSLTTAGRYKIVAGGRESYPFDIRSDIFNQATRSAQRFFYYQRAFTEIVQPYAEGPWVHPTDIGKAPAGVVKGWHDAGDLTVYNATMTQALFWLLETWSDFRPTEDNTNIPESGNAIPDLLDEARWGLEWLLSMQDGSGGFWMNATAANGSNSYEYGRTFPHTVNPYIKTVSPCLQATSKAVAVLAYASKVYRPFNATFADACLAAARRGWAWIQANPNATYDGEPAGGSNFNIYSQGSDPVLLRSNIMWAASSMLYATGETQFAAAFDQNFEQVQGISSYSRSEAFAATMYIRAGVGASTTRQAELRQRFYLIADAVRNEANEHPFQFATAYYWGCNSNAMHTSGQFMWRTYLMDTTRIADRNQAMLNLDYIFGRNYRNQCYVSGIAGASKPRLRGFHHWMKALNATPFHFPGALAGGPNQSPEQFDVSYPNNQPFPTWGYFGDTANVRDCRTPVDGRFTDNDSWSTNEIVVSWNAALLYNLYGARMIATGASIPLFPSGNFFADPDSLPEGGGNVTLTWQSSNATSASITPNIGIVPLNGTRTVAVQQTTTFTLILSNQYGNQSYGSTVWVGSTDELPKDFFLEQNLPNPFADPFNPQTTIRFSVPVLTHVNISVYNTLGQRVRILLNEQRPRGNHTVQWDGTNDKGVLLGSGMYIYVMSAGGFVEPRRVMLLK